MKCNITREGRFKVETIQFVLRYKTILIFNTKKIMQQNFPLHGFYKPKQQRQQ